jgi:S-adenosylmethionine:tRNA ribosyltransferase-isomerase
MLTADFDFELPSELIAQQPAPARDESRLLVLSRTTGQVTHRRFRDLLAYLRAGDVLVLNNSRVIPARLRGANATTGGRFEILLLEEAGPNDWWAMMRPGKRARAGTHITLLGRDGVPAAVRAVVAGTNAEGHRRLRFEGTPDILQTAEEIGQVPLPPYITREPGAHDPLDLERYQTVYAQPAGSVAAPTAGLHFTEALLAEVRALGVTVCFVTLHVGLGTFAPVKAETLAAHTMHEERYELSPETAGNLNAARQEGRRIFAVGTTTLRVLESVASPAPGAEPASPLLLAPGPGKTRIFIYPPYRFRVVDALVTNFHLPRSTLLMLASAFAAPGETRGRDLVLATYAEAIRERYRFFSYGDAMLIV